MPLFRCFIRGENFPGKLLERPGLLGFHTTRFVEAESPEQAELLALDLLRDDAGLAVAAEHRTQEAQVFFETIEEIPADSARTPNKGFTFFPMED